MSTCTCGVLGCVLKQGPKLRIGLFDKDPILVDGQHFRFDLQDDIGDAARVKLPHPEILETLRVGDVLLVDDGKLRMKVTARQAMKASIFADTWGNE